MVKQRTPGEPLPLPAKRTRGIHRNPGYRLWVGGPVPPGSAGITLGSLVIVRTKAARSDRLLRHELVHVRQWKYLGVVRFLWQYLGAYFKGRLKGRSHRDAYRRIPLEVEADWESRLWGRTPSSTG